MNSTAHNHYWASRLTGGSSDALDAIDHSDAGGSGYALQTGDVALVHNSTSKLLYPFRYSSGSTEAESSPDYIKPDSVGAGTGAWEKEKIAKTCVENSTAWDTVITDLISHSTNPNAHHSQSHTIASHSDTTATGAELETLTDGSNADSLHDHEYMTCDLTNKSGDTVTVGYVYRSPDPDNDNSIDYASEDEDARVAIAIIQVANNSVGNFALSGCVDVYVDGVTDSNISLGIKYLYFSSTQGQAKISADRRDGCFGETLEDSSGAGLVHARIYTVPPRKWSWLDEQTWPKHVILPAHATAGADGIQKFASNPVVANGGAGAFDEDGVLHPGVIAVQDNDLVYVYYSGEDDTYNAPNPDTHLKWSIGVATLPLDNVEQSATKFGQIMSASGGTWEDQSGFGLMNPSPLYNKDAQNSYDTGTATAVDATGKTMTDSGATWTINQWADCYIANLSDTGGANAIGGVGRITSNSGTILQIPGGMSGGSANDWQINDSYFIMDTKFQLFYVGAGGDAANSSVGMAVSTDGTTMVKVGKVVAHGFGNTLNTYPSLSAIRLGRVIFLFYKDTAGQISGAYSVTNGFSWTSIGTVLSLGAGGTWNDFILGDFKVTQNQGNLYATFFGGDTGIGAGGKYQVGLAINTVRDFLTGTVTFNEYFLNPMVYTANPNSSTWDSGAHFGPDHIFYNDTMYMWYGALENGGSVRQIGLMWIKRNI